MSDLYYQAPAMFADYPDSGDYDLMIVNWYCDIDAPKTYWSLFQFANTSVVEGYAGFQNKDYNNKHTILLSIWELDGKDPEIEYISPYSDESNLLFSGEGNGKHIFTDYPWITETWYTMCLGVRNYGGKTHYAQWISEKGSNKWLLCGVISFPQTNRKFERAGAFQEAFNRNNYVMRCRLQDAFGRYYDTNQWHQWNSYLISNLFRPYVDPDTLQHNIDVDCLYGVNTTDNYLWLQAGGGLLDPANSASHTGVLFGTETLSSGDTPEYTPSWSPLAPRYIKNHSNGKYIAPDSNGSLIYRDEAYYWHFVETSGGYVKILNTDKTLALSITGTTSGSTLALTTPSTSDSQKWKTTSYYHNEFSYISPKNAPSLDINISNNNIVISAHSTTTTSSMWKIMNKCVLKSFRSYISGLSVTPSNNIIVQTNVQYKWNIIWIENNSNDTDYIYFSIVTTDNKKAITLPDNAVSGTDLILADYEPGNKKQIWKKESAGSTLFYVKSMFNQNLALDVQGQSTYINAPIQVLTYSAGSNRLKWYIE